MAQRAPLSLFVLAALALQGCGKDVEKTGRVEAQVNPGPATIPVPMASPVPSGVPVYPTIPTVTGGPDTGGPQPDGSCADPIGQIQYPIATFADLTRWNTGRWALDRVVTYTVAQVRPGQPDARTATSALEIHPYSNRPFRPICKDMRQMAAGFVTWSTDVPLKIDAVNGDVEQDLVILETVVGPQSSRAGQREASSVEADCTNVEGSMGGLSAQHCKPIMVYQIDVDHIVVVKTSETRDTNGSVVTVRSAAYYELLGAYIPGPASSPRPSPSPANPAQANPGQTPVVVPANPGQTNPVQF